MKVGIEWGHFPTGDVGAVYEGRREYDDNLRLAKAVGERLAQLGFEVYYPKEQHIWQNNAEKFRLINAEAPDLYLSFHRNAFNGKARGFEVYTRTGYSQREQRLATCLHDEVVKVPGVIDRGIKRKNFDVCTKVNYPAVLTETLFLDNDADNLIYDTHLDELAEAYARGICAYAGVPYVAVETAPDHSNCEKRVAELLGEVALLQAKIQVIDREWKSRHDALKRRVSAALEEE